MSAEVETNPEEGVKEVKNLPTFRIKKKLRFYIELGLLVIKILELFICVVCMSLVYEPIHILDLGKIHLHHVGIMYTAITGYMLINGVILLSRVLGERVPYRTQAIFAIMGCALFLVTGILLIVDRPLLRRQYYSSIEYLLVMLTVTVVLTFLNALLFATDAVFNFVMFMS